MYNLVRVSINENFNLLEKFIHSLGQEKESFRYFETREVSSIKNHLITCLIVDNDTPIGYGHIDFDGTIFWLGICILQNFQGRGIGRYIIRALINECKNKNIGSIYLTVDKENISAIKLYESFSFKTIDFFQDKNVYKYKLMI